MADTGPGKAVRTAETPGRDAPEAQGKTAGAGSGSGAVAGRRLSRQGRNRKAQLLDHAATLFAQRGYQETRVVDIVRAAGVAKGLFYWYFENKEALFRELVISTRERLRIRQVEATKAEPDPLKALALAIAASLDFVIDNYNLYSLIATTSVQERFSDIMSEAVNQSTVETARAISRCQKQGVIRGGDPVQMAVAVNGVVASFAGLAAGRHQKDGREEMMRSCAEFCLRGVVSDPELVGPALSALDKN